MKRRKILPREKYWHPVSVQFTSVPYLEKRKATILRLARDARQARNLAVLKSIPPSRRSNYIAARRHQYRHTAVDQNWLATLTQEEVNVLRCLIDYANANGEVAGVTLSHLEKEAPCALKWLPGAIRRLECLNLIHVARIPGHPYRYQLLDGELLAGPAFIPQT